MDDEDGIGDRGLLERCCVAVVGTQRALLEDRFVDEATSEQDDALAPGKRADPDQVGDGLEPVRFGEQPGKAGPPIGPAGITVGDVPRREVVRVARER